MQIAEGGVGTAVLSGCDAALVRAGLVNLPCCTICDQRGGTKPWQVHFQDDADLVLRRNGACAWRGEYRAPAFRLAHGRVGQMISGSSSLSLELR